MYVMCWQTAVVSYFYSCEQALCLCFRSHICQYQAGSVTLGLKGRYQVSLSGPCRTLLEPLLEDLGLPKGALILVILPLLLLLLQISFNFYFSLCAIYIVLSVSRVFFLTLTIPVKLFLTSASYNLSLLACFVRPINPCQLYHSFENVVVPRRSFLHMETEACYQRISG